MGKTSCYGGGNKHDEVVVKILHCLTPLRQIQPHSRGYNEAAGERRDTGSYPWVFKGGGGGGGVERGGGEEKKK